MSSGESDGLNEAIQFKLSLFMPRAALCLFRFVFW